MTTMTPTDLFMLQNTIQCEKCGKPIDFGNGSDISPNGHKHDAEWFHDWCCSHGDVDWDEEEMLDGASPDTAAS